MENKKSFIDHLITYFCDNYPLIALVLTGIITTASIPTHVDTIINSFSLIVAFYMFGFVLMSVVNVFNGFNLSKKKTWVSFIITSCCVLIYVLFVVLYANILITEIKEGNMYIERNAYLGSFILLGIGSILSITSLISMFYLHRRYGKTDNRFLIIWNNKE